MPLDSTIMVNGRIFATRQSNGFVSFEWEGANVVGITDELIEDADPDYLALDGELLTIGPYKLKVLGRDELRNVVIAERLPGFTSEIIFTAPDEAFIIPHEVQ
jgi:hypothetical protein